MGIDKVNVDPTGLVDVDPISDQEALEEELKAMTKDELLQRLNFEETDPDVIKLIKKILKTK